MAKRQITNIPRKATARMVPAVGGRIVSAFRSNYNPFPPIDPGIYVNPEFAGGAPSGPVDGNNPPTAHSIGFNTANSAPGDPGVWIMNPEEVDGRCYLQYNLADNHPGLAVGTVVQFQWTVENLSGTSATVMADQAGARQGVALEFNQQAIPQFAKRYLRAKVTIQDALYVCNLRIGLGATTSQPNHVIVSQASAVLV